MIPVLNGLQNVTLLAPVNSAFAAASLDHLNNEELLSYIIDQRFRVGYMSRESVVLNTLYSVNNRSVPVLVSPDFQRQQYVVDRKSYIVDPDIYAKHQWSFIQAIDHFIPIKPSVCDMLMAEESSFNGLQISFVKRLFFALFQADTPETENAAKKPKKKKPALPKTCEEFFQIPGTLFIPTDDYISSSMTNMTERYYSALYHTLSGTRFTTTPKAATEIRSDIFDLLQHLMVPRLVTGGNTTNKKMASLSKAVTYKLSPSTKDDTVVLNEMIQSRIEGSNVLFSNGVVHIFDAQKPANFFDALNIPVVELTPKKALLALHYANFVKELGFRSLDNLIDGSTVNQTIFLSTAQRDDVVNDDTVQDEYAGTSFSSKQELLYQFADDVVDLLHTDKSIQNSTFYKLVNSKLCSKKRINGCFKLKISSSYNYEHKLCESRLNDDIKVIGGPYYLGSKNIAYIVDDDVEAPVSFKHTLGEMMSNGGVDRHLEHIQIDQTECLRTIQYLSDSKLLSPKENGAGYSVLLPCGIPTYVSRSPKRRGTWKSLGLVMNYLEQNPKILAEVLKGFFVEGMIYSDFGLDSKNTALVSRTLRGDKVNITSAYYDGDYNHLLRINETLISLPLNSDLVFNQGVIHIVSDVMFPENFRVSFLDLIKATETEGFKMNFLELLQLFPKLSKALALDGKSVPEYSLLVPTPESLAAFNITEDFTKLFDFLQLHLIPNTELESLFACTENARIEENTGETDTGYLIHSNHTDVTYRCFKNPGNNKSYLEVARKNREGIVQAKHKVKIVSSGCTTPDHLSVEDSACVFLLDRPINPKWLVDKNRGFLHVQLGFLSVGIGIILGLALFCGVIFVLMFSLSGNKKKKDKSAGPNGSIFEAPGPSFMRVTSDEDMDGYDRGYETDDDMFFERERLLPTDDPRRHRNYGATTSKTAEPMVIKASTLNRNRNLPAM